MCHIGCNMAPQLFSHDCRVSYCPGGHLLGSIHQLLVPETCQEYYQNSILFSHFLLTLCYTNNFIPYLFIFLMISDHQQEQETRILVSSTATNAFTPPSYHHILDQYLSHHPKRLPETPPYLYQLDLIALFLSQSQRNLQAILTKLIGSHCALERPKGQELMRKQYLQPP